MQVLLITAGPPERKIALSELPAMIGRDVTADVCMADSWVGRFQCMLDEEGGVLRVLDLGSRIGTFVNGQRVKKATLLPGDVLTLGMTDYLVQYELPPQAVPYWENPSAEARP